MIVRLFFFLTLLASVALGAPVPLPPMPERPDSGRGPTRVGMTAWFADISKIDSAAQSFSASLVVVMRWNDPSLVHPGPGAKTYPVD